MCYDALPPALRENALFCVWRREPRNGKTTKVPYEAVSGNRAKSNDEATFCDYQTALGVVSAYDGLGIGIFHGICALDIDHCFECGQPSAMAQDIIKTMDAYTELSPSGTGIRILFNASGFHYDKARYYINNQKLGLEAYVTGATNKFVTVTGNVLLDRDICERGEALKKVLDKYMLRPQKVDSSVAPAKSYLSDKSVIDRACASANGEKFKRLWSGDVGGYASASEADMALASMLAFWCGGDITQMDRLFRQSGLFREKWDRPQGGSTYGRITLEQAVSGTTEFYTPGGIRAADNTSTVSQRLAEMCPENNPLYGWTDIGNSRLFADCYKSVARFVPERKLWYVYDGKRWTPDIGALKAMELCKELADGLLLYAVSIEDERQRSAYIDHCRKWQARRNRETILKDAQGIYPISMDEFDAAPYLFNTSNGTLNLRTMEFQPHNAEDRLTKISGVKYDSEAKCERFEQFIREIMSGDEGKARFLQKSLGYAISGDTRYECLFILYGATTRNGKGTLMESVLKALGDYGRTVRPESISLKQNVSSQNPTEDIARLAGIRFANISEPSRGLVLNAAQVKSMTGNDSLNARFLHENSFDFRPQFKLYINANFLPVITDMTLFSSGRVVIIPFDRHFDEAEQDRTLKREFAKAKNQSAILNWLIEGYRLLCEEGISQPEAVKAATMAYRHDSDKITLFMEEALEPRANGEARTAEVYTRYRQWCADNGCFAENMRNFRQALSSIARVERRRPRSGGGATTLLVGYSLSASDGIFPC